MVKNCPKCGKENSNGAKFCEGCGTDLGGVINVSGNTSNSSGGFSGWWNKQGKGGKAAVGLVGLCCIGLILIVAVGGMMSPDKTTTNATSTPTATTQTTSAAQTPTTATISNCTIMEYTNTASYVKVTGTVIQSDGTNLRIEDSDGQDIMVQGDSVNGYEGQTI